MILFCPQLFASIELKQVLGPYETPNVNVESMARLYDDGETQVFSPHFHVDSTVANDSITVGAGYSMDVVTSSSADVRSWSSTGRISDTRREVEGDLKFNLESGSVSFGYIQSEEH